MKKKSINDLSDVDVDNISEAAERSRLGTKLYDMIYNDPIDKMLDDIDKLSDIDIDVIEDVSDMSSIPNEENKGNLSAPDGES